MDHTLPAPRPLRLGAQVLAAALLTPLAIGLLASAGGAGDWARHELPLGFQPSRARPGDVAALWLHNLRAVALPLLGAAALSGLSRTAGSWRTARALLDALLLVSGAANLLMLAVSIAGYGPVRMARWLPHLPFEFAALAAAVAAYLLARRAPLRAAQLARTAATAVALLGVAAVLETYGVPHR
jgi:hypothetical protein